MPKIEDLKVRPFRVWDCGTAAFGTEASYRLDGKPALARVPWELSAEQFVRYLEQQHARMNK